jgi:hypothetical protein
MIFGVVYKLQSAPDSIPHLNGRTLAVQICSYLLSFSYCIRFARGEKFISFRWKSTPLVNDNNSRMVDGNRRSIVCLAALAAAADVLLPSHDE